MTITQLNKKAIAVTGLPEGRECEITSYKDESYLNIWGVEDIKLPPGNWSILGFSQDLKEEDWERVVERHDLYEGSLYYNYTGEIFFTNALESGHSLLKSKGLHVSNPYSKPSMSDYSFPEDGPTDSMLLSAEHDFEFKYAKWQSAELLTNHLILIQ